MRLNYTEAVDYILNVPKFTTKNKPEHTRELLKRLGHPDRGMKVIHVAGTNGKGSVCAFLSEMLVLAGKRTALFTSPHLVRINERFQIDQVPISDELFLESYLEVQAKIDEMVEEGLSHATYFELLYATAMVAFQKERAEYVVLETGLGGRLDATNTIEHPLATVITSISLDHTEILGDTIEEIAVEKAGIIKEGVPVIYDGRNKEAEKVILERAEQMHAPAFGLREEMYEILGNTDKSIDFSLNCGYYEHTKVTAPYLAPYQVRNSALALLAMDVIDTDREIPIDLRVEAIGKTRWQGRMETILPGVVVDGAHNSDGIAEFVRTVQNVQDRYRIVLLFSAVVEKDYEKMIETICTQTNPAAVVVTEIKGDRIVPAEELSLVFQAHTKACVVTQPDIRAAFEQALALKEDGLLFCAGSLYLVGEIKTILEEKKDALS
ncbi:MAG: bifunctional folylpolyglutamate synthase/dihydrofolate synthase [Firmicutes bacterium]|nr:bifunctional folylpolyglutamate synthase/dihydrofolate synthase [Bacillota bacterium]